MNPNDTHREHLSALIDGALDADQSRFLLRRLQHDGELADRLSRWQLAGDVLRGQADAPAPINFAEVVAARIAGEPLPLIEGEGIAMPSHQITVAPKTVAARTTATTATRWRWFGGGAMAASLAIASILALRPDTSALTSTDYAVTEATSTTPLSTSPSDIQAASSQTSANAAPSRVAAAETTPARVVSPTSSDQTTRSRAAVQAPVRVARATPAPSRTTRSSDRVSDASELRAVTATADSAVRTAQLEPTKTADPFTPPAAKAWPRAVLPSAGNGTFNASLNSGATYYPFSPRGTETTDIE